MIIFVVQFVDVYKHKKIKIIIKYYKTNFQNYFLIIKIKEYKKVALIYLLPQDNLKLP